MESNNTNTCLENDVLKSIEDNLKNEYPLGTHFY